MIINCILVSNLTGTFFPRRYLIRKEVLRDEDLVRLSINNTTDTVIVEGLNSDVNYPGLNREHINLSIRHNPKIVVGDLLTSSEYKEQLMIVEIVKT